MVHSLDLYLIPDVGNEALRFSRGFPLLSPVYKINGEGTLLRRCLPGGHSGRSAILTASFPASLEECKAKSLCSQIRRELSGKGLRRMVLELRGEGWIPFLRVLLPVLADLGIWPILHPEFARLFPKAGVIIPSSLSGGTFSGMLCAASETYGPRLVLQLCPIAADFVLPFTGSDGEALSPEAFGALFSKHQTHAYFSRDLCEKYFTYMDAHGQAHFVLFDDGATLSAKLQKAAAQGIHTAFASWACMEEFLPQLSSFAASS